MTGLHHAMHARLSAVFKVVQAGGSLEAAELWAGSVHTPVWQGSRPWQRRRSSAWLRLPHVLCQRSARQLPPEELQPGGLASTAA